MACLKRGSTILADAARVRLVHDGPEGVRHRPVADIGELTDSQYLNLAQEDMDGRFLI